eukprot:g1604.t1
METLTANISGVLLASGALLLIRYRVCHRQRACQQQQTLHTLETPAIVVERAVLDNNIAAMQARASRAGAVLRPHIKTHKSLAVAALQVRAGAVGVTASKPDEALVFLRAGFDVLLAYPLVCARKVRRLLRGAAACGARTRLCLMVDSVAGVQAIIAAARAQGWGSPLPVMLKVDVGLGRCGVLPDGEALRVVVRAVCDAAPLLALRGLMSHAGHAYGAKGGRESVRAMAAEEASAMRRAARAVRAAAAQHGGGAGVVPGPGPGAGPRPWPHELLVSVGSTPTELVRDDYGGVGELRPGNYVFLDGTPLRLGLASADDVALTVVATVVSTSAQYAIIDAGSKVLSSDTGPHGSGGGASFGRAWSLRDEGTGKHKGRAELLADAWHITKLSEEHGWIELGRSGHGRGTGARALAVGERVRILVNHSCPVANLADEYAVLGPDGCVEGRWRVDARGCAK